MEGPSGGYAKALLFVSLCLIWGTTWLAIKVGLDDLPPFLSAAIRMMIAAGLLFFWKWLRGISREGGQREPHGFLFLLSFFWITLPYGFVYWGEQYVSSGLSAVLFATMPFHVATMGHFWLPGEELTARKAAGLLVGFLGVLVIFLEGTGSPAVGDIRGIIVLLLSPLAASISSILAKRRIASLHPVASNAWVMAYGTIFLFLGSLLFESDQTARFSGRAIFTLFYLGIIGTALAFSVYLYLLKAETALKMSLIAYITPVIALFVGWLVRGEVISLEIAAGSVLVFLGVHLVTRRGHVPRNGSNEVSSSYG